MLSYQHHYHAGNHADVLKHWVLLAGVRHLLRKSRPFDYIDTHAGAGLYTLDHMMALKTRESEDGVGRLLADPVDGMADYINQISPLVANDKYPGSPRLVQSLLRPDDPSWLFELHPQTCPELIEQCGKRRKTHVRQADGYAALPVLLPTPSRRALVLMDPSYEVKSDFSTVIKVLRKAWQRMPQAMLMLWYPIIDRYRVDELMKEVMRSKMADAHRYEIGVQADEEPGMSGSGMIVINPPWTLTDQARAVLPVLSKVLSTDNQSRSTIERLTAE